MKSPAATEITMSDVLRNAAKRSRPRDSADSARPAADCRGGAMRGSSDCNASLSSTENVRRFASRLN
jgi:hypothetical protein